MTDRDELVRAVTGSWRLLLGDARAMAWFDTSIDGFWRSFRAMILVLPAAIADLMAQRVLPATRRLDPSVLDGPAFWFVGLGAYVLAWIAFPLVLALLARPLGLQRVYVPYMVARNWASLVAAVPLFVVTLLFLAGILTATALDTLGFAVLGFGIYYAWRVTWIACATPPGLTGGLVALDIVLSLVVYGLADRLIGL